MPLANIQALELENLKMQKQHHNIGQSLPKQFLVTQRRIDPPDSWQILGLGGYNVYCPSNLGVVHIRNRSSKFTDENTISEFVVLGWFGYKDKFYPNSDTNTLHAEGDFESVYAQMTGRFVVIHLEGNDLYCTTDAGAQFPVVYRAATGEVASTAGLLNWTQPLNQSATIEGAYQRIDDTYWVPFQDTPYSGIRRLLPRRRLRLGKHGCELTNWKPQPSKLLDVAGLVERTGGFIRSLVNSQDSVECHLTAGWDSRMVLAASWKDRDRIRYLTYRTAGANSRVDSQVASAIAGKYSLNHGVIPVTSPSDVAIAEWMARTSYCIKDSVSDLCETVATTYNDCYGLAGVGGEVGRAFYWNKSDIGRTGLSAQELLNRLGFRPGGIAMERAENWLSAYSDYPTTQILDQAYIDIRLGCWSGPSLCGHLVDKPTLSPFNNLDVYESMIRLSEDYRLSGDFARDFIAISSAELSQIPVNRLWGIRRWLGLPRELAKKLPKGIKAQIREALPRSAAA